MMSRKNVYHIINFGLLTLLILIVHGRLYSQCEKGLEKYYSSFAPNYPETIPNGWHFVTYENALCKLEKESVRVKDNKIVEILCTGYWRDCHVSINNPPYQSEYIKVVEPVIQGGKIENAKSIIKYENGFVDFYFLHFLDQIEEYPEPPKKEIKLSELQYHYSWFYKACLNTYGHDLLDDLLYGKYTMSGVYNSGKKVILVDKKPTPEELTLLYASDEIRIYENELVSSSQEFLYKSSSEFKQILKDLLSCDDIKDDYPSYTGTPFKNVQTLKIYASKAQFSSVFKGNKKGSYSYWEIVLPSLKEFYFNTSDKSDSKYSEQNNFLKLKGKNKLTEEQYLTIFDVFIENRYKLEVINIEQTNLAESLRSMNEKRREALILKYEKVFPNLVDFIY